MKDRIVEKGVKKASFEISYNYRYLFFKIIIKLLGFFLFKLNFLYNLGGRKI